MANFTLKKPNCIDMIFANAINSPITLLPNWNPGANWIVDLYFREINFRNRIIHIIQLFSLENNRPVSEDKESDFSWVWRTLTPKKILCLLLFSFKITSVSPQFLSDVRGLSIQLFNSGKTYIHCPKAVLFFQFHIPVTVPTVMDFY